MRKTRGGVECGERRRFDGTVIVLRDDKSATVSRSGKGWREEEGAFLNCSSEDHASRHCIVFLFGMLVGGDDADSV